jgi:thioredoxin reductase (NADPH)
VIGSIVLVALLGTCEARPLVRHIRSSHEFDRLLEKHTTQTGLPVIVDFYSDGCGPCRMMAPIFKKLAGEIGQEKAVFAKVDTNAIHELSSRYAIRSIPTFLFFVNGKKVNEFSGAGEQQLRQYTQDAIQRAEQSNVELTLETLMAYYQKVDPSKDPSAVESIYKKCTDMNKNRKITSCVGNGASQLARRLRQKYKEAPPLQPRFTADDRKSGNSNKDGNTRPKSTGNSSNSSSNAKPDLGLVSKEELLAELERRLELEEEAKVEEEEDDEAEFEHGWAGPGDFPERVVIVGGGPAGMSAAIYAARAGLTPLVIAPPMGGQLQGKGVDVENYPGLSHVTGPAIVAAMRQQAIHFGAVFEADTVTRIDATTRPLQVYTNSSTTPIDTHTIIVSTGAESNWLNIPGEYELRGGGVSSCATCDGHFYRDQTVLVVGGGDSAMEEALVLARTSKHVILVHRRDTFRASKIMAERVMNHPSITIEWNTTVSQIIGAHVDDNDSDNEQLDFDQVKKVVTAVLLKRVDTGETFQKKVQAVFVAIGHTPTTSFLQGVVEFDPHHAGYVKTHGKSTQTTVPGIFAAGDVSDAIYRQAITSAGSGAAAALDAESYLNKEGLGNEAAEFEAELLAELMATDNTYNRDTIESAYNVYDDAGGRMSGMKESARMEL